MYGNQTPPWILSAMQGLAGNQQQQPEAQGMQANPVQAQALTNPITDTQNNTAQQNLGNQGGMGQGNQQQQQQAPLMQPQQAMANDPLMSGDSWLNFDQKLFGSQGGMGGMMGMFI